MSRTGPSFLAQSRLMELLQHFDLRPDKSLGQHFLIDGNILRKILSLGGDAEAAVEIGCGPGLLTLPLAGTYSHLLGIEVDRRMKPLLDCLLLDYPGVRLHFADAMEVVWQDLLEDMPKSRVIYGNLPYNVAPPIIHHFLASRVSWCRAIFMLQREVVQRITASPGGKEYGVLTLSVAYHAHAKLVQRVKPNSFYPPPEVESALLFLEPRIEDCEVSFSTFMRVVRAAFHVRRKTLRNALKTSPELSLSVDLIERWLHDAAIDPQVRGERLTLEEFLRLARIFELHYRTD